MEGEMASNTKPLGDPITYTFTVTNTSSVDTFNFKPELTAEPTTAADGSIPTETLSLNFDKISWRTFDGSIDGLAVDPTDPNTGNDFLAWQRQVGPVETEAALLI